MATTTPNFGWPVPTSTDLVKNGATAIEGLGDAIDASLLDLKGGTTGQVLAKATNTDMDFSWVAQDDSNAIQNAIVDAKGDLIAASANDTPARLAVGNNGETLVADSSTSTGLRYQSGYNGNAIINGGLDIWQRGTSFSSFVAVYTADRWLPYRSGSVTGFTVSRQSSGLTGIQYSMRTQRDSGNTSTQDIYNTYSLESADSYRFAGQTVTLSFYAKVGANFSGASSNGIAFLYSGTGTDQNLFGGFTGRVTVGSSTPALTTSWQRFTITGTVASNATQMGLLIGYVPTGTAGANDWIEITGVQLELGSVATNFKRSSAGGGSIQGELAACMRYAINLNYNPAGKSSYNTIANGYASSTTAARIAVNLPVAMRTQPSSITTSGNFGLDNISSVPAVTSITINQGGTTTVLLAANVASGLTSGQNLTLYSNNDVNANLILSAEL